MKDAHNIPSDVGGRITLFHIMVISLSLMLTLGAWQFSRHQVEERIELRFQAEIDRTVALISDRMSKYEDALWAGVAAIESHEGDISRQNWRTFTQNLQVNERYPGVNGIGVIRFLNLQTLPDYLEEQRRKRPDFRIFPDHDQSDFMPITFIEPEEINAAAVGLDVAHETNRRTAALESRDLGSAQITGPIVLVQDAGKTPGFLFYAPFYEGGPKSNVANRRKSALGAVYAPFVVHKLMGGLLAKELRAVRFGIQDGDETIFDEHTTDDPLFDPEPMFAQQITLDLYGRNWLLDMRSNLAFRQENTSAQPTLILLAGLTIECLIISLLLLMARANKHAISYADRVTVALRRHKEDLVKANAQLASKNEELERFVYVASHDLKTPIRGINGLTEMVQEDLEDYFVSPQANPDVSINLERIQERVARMYELTKGIMNLSRIEVNIIDAKPIHLDEMLSDLALDFGVDSDQIKLSGDTTTITVDPVNFRSVMENLIGNAIKYHETPEDIRIEVIAQKCGDKTQVCVSDNGPGIDPKYHGRIFDVFETLRRDGEPESTGIGLSIVKKAVERHGGTVTLVSVPQKGAKFGFDWPDAPAKSVSQRMGWAA